MKVEEISSYSFEFDDEEMRIIVDVVKLLGKIVDVLKKHNCENIGCDDYVTPVDIHINTIEDTSFILNELRNANNIY